jgi:hypothetical protein
MGTMKKLLSCDQALMANIAETLGTAGCGSWRTTFFSKGGEPYPVSLTLTTFSDYNAGSTLLINGMVCKVPV